MRTLLNGMFLLFICLNCIASDSTKVKENSIDNICKERGHIVDFNSITCVYCQPEIIDLKDRTIRIFHDTNIKSGFCKRCRKYIKEPVQEKPDTTIIWKSNILKSDTIKSIVPNLDCFFFGHIVHFDSTYKLYSAPISYDLKDKKIKITFYSIVGCGRCDRCKKFIEVPYITKADTLIMPKN